MFFPVVKKTLIYNSSILARFGLVFQGLPKTIQTTSGLVPPSNQTMKTTTSKNLGTPRISKIARSISLAPSMAMSHWAKLCLGISLGGSLLAPLPSFAAAQAKATSTISINSLFNANLVPANFDSFGAHADTGFHAGNADDNHYSEIINSGNYLPDGDFSATTTTILNLEVWAEHPWGYAYASGFADAGYTINLLNAGLVRFNVSPSINVSAHTDHGGEYAWANFFYNVTWNGVTINPTMLPNTLLSADLHFFHANGSCVTFVCDYTYPLSNFTIDLPGVVGQNILRIDPVSDTNGVAVPGPLPLLGIAAALRSARRIRKLTNCRRIKDVSVN
jgi:hypothetical protein